MEFVPDGKPHEILCCIDGYSASDRDDVDCGERLELKNFYGGSCKVLIGMEGDCGCFPDGSRAGIT